MALGGHGLRPWLLAMALGHGIRPCVFGLNRPHMKATNTIISRFCTEFWPESKGNSKNTEAETTMGPWSTDDDYDDVDADEDESLMTAPMVATVMMVMV